MPNTKNADREVKQPNPQKFSWKQQSRHKTYASADSARNKLKDEGVKHVKVRRCGPGGTEYKVSVGASLEKKNTKPKKKKEKSR